jgi:membrane protein insertase Oxa1/YidC/SpoIIIJ
VANLNRRSKAASTPAESIAALQSELSALRELYVRDMQNISADMQALSAKVEPAAVSED